MKSVFCTGYGSPDVLRIVEIPKPSPGPYEIVIRVRATTVTSADWRIRSLEMPPGFGLLARLIFGFLKPRQPILGSEVAGEVDLVGEAVTTFRPGDRVVAFVGARMGCHAEFKCIKASDCVATLPPEIDYATAAALPFGGTTAMHFIRKTSVRLGDKVLVIGSSGSVGSSIVQLAHHLGASVTGVCSSLNVNFVKSLGAKHTIDYTQQDIRSSGEQFDVVFETVGSLDVRHSLPLVRNGGRLAIIAGGMGDMVLSTFAGKLRGIAISAGPAGERLEDLEELIRLVSSQAFRPVIDSTYSFEDIRRAHARVETKRKRGSVIVLLE